MSNPRRHLPLLALALAASCSILGEPVVPGADPAASASPGVSPEAGPDGTPAELAHAATPSGQGDRAPGAAVPAATAELVATFDRVDNGEAWITPPPRPWVGPDWHATRVQDWRLADGRVACQDGRPGPAGRTLALLTRTVTGPLTAPVGLTTTVEPVEPAPDGAWEPGAHAGVLFGIGGADVDWRRSALVQQAPGADGGLLLAVDHAGRLKLVDFETPLDGGYWTLPTKVDHGALPVLAEGERPTAVDVAPVELTLELHPGPAPGRVTLRALAAPLGHLGMPVVLEHELDEADVLGSLSLFSARGGAGSALGFGFDHLTLTGATAHPERARGPVLATTYLVDGSPRREPGGTLRMTAHLAALGAEGPSGARLWLQEDDGATWRLAALGDRDPVTDLVHLTVPGYRDRPDGRPRAYRVEVDVVDVPVAARAYGGSIRPEPATGDALVLASLSCLKNQVGPIAWNGSGLWFPHERAAAEVLAEDPDLVYFSGDQLYEGDLTGPDRRTPETALLDYRTKFDRFLWSFEELLRTRPSVLVPDDHDVFHGNLWGAGGILGKGRDGLSAQDAGGYKMGAAFVNAVHASQVGNLPPSRIDPVVGDGVTTYATAFTWGGLDVAVLGDRMFKDSPSVAAPAGAFRNGWPQAEGFDPAADRAPDAQLLGPLQEAFLADWAADPAPGTWARLVLSQTPFACLHTLPSGTRSDAAVGRQEPPAPGTYVSDDAPVSDADSNGWPQTARDRAVALLAEAGALHLTGDQHLGTVAWYGLDAHRDGTVAFTSPSLANTWPRRWMPREAGGARPEGMPRHTGDYRDGFGNRVTMLATANPYENGREPRLLMNRAPGFGIVRFDPAAARVTLEAWPLWRADAPGVMYPGWPVVLGPDGRPAPEDPWGAPAGE